MILSIRDRKKSSINKALRNIKENVNISKAPKQYKSGYNCWGFTAYAFGWTNDLFWLNPDSIEEYLISYSRKVNVPKIGDIVVWRSRKGKRAFIDHTAIITGVHSDSSNQILHKPGGLALELMPQEKVNKLYPYGGIIEYRRPYKKGLLDQKSA